VNEFEALLKYVEREIDRSEGNLFLCFIVIHRSHMEWPVRWKEGVRSLNHGMAFYSVVWCDP